MLNASPGLNPPQEIPLVRSGECCTMGRHHRLKCPGVITAPVERIIVTVSQHTGVKVRGSEVRGVPISENADLHGR
jgi:hypothetical protein